MLKTKKRKKILKTTREKDHITYRGTKVKLKKISQSESMRTRRHVEREKNPKTNKKNKKLATENSTQNENILQKGCQIKDFFQTKKR